MAKCIKCGTTENIVFSGVDALVLGVPELTEKICFKCAKKK